MNCKCVASAIVSPFFNMKWDMIDWNGLSGYTTEWVTETCECCEEEKRDQFVYLSAKHSNYMIRLCCECNERLEQDYQEANPSDD